jgi:hypothetical protein
MNGWLLLLGLLVLVIGGGLAIGYVHHAGRMVCRPRQTLVQSAGLDIRPGLDPALCANRGGWLGDTRWSSKTPSPSSTTRPTIAMNPT